MNGECDKVFKEPQKLLEIKKKFHEHLLMIDCINTRQCYLNMYMHKKDRTGKSPAVEDQLIKKHHQLLVQHRNLLAYTGRNRIRIFPSKRTPPQKKNIRGAQMPVYKQFLGKSFNPWLREQDRIKLSCIRVLFLFFFSLTTVIILKYFMSDMLLHPFELLG